MPRGRRPAPTLSWFATSLPLAVCGVWPRGSRAGDTRAGSPSNRPSVPTQDGGATFLAICRSVGWGKSHGGSPRALSVVTPAHWEEHFGVTPSDLIAAARGDWAMALFAGWCRASVLHQESSWAVPLWRSLLPIRTRSRRLADLGDCAVHGRSTAASRTSRSLIGLLPKSGEMPSVFLLHCRRYPIRGNLTCPRLFSKACAGASAASANTGRRRGRSRG